MDTNTIDRNHVENNIALGITTFSFQHYSDWWQEKNRIQAFVNAYSRVATEFSSKGHEIGFYLTKLVIVTSSVQDVALFWKQQLSRQVGYNERRGGMVGGQTFVWGDGSAEKTYAIIILHEIEAQSLVLEGDSSHNEKHGRNVLIHEIGHVETELVYIQLFKDQEMTTWIMVYRSLVETLYGEFYSTTIAMNETGPILVRESEEMFYDLLQYELQAIKNEINLYRAHGDLDKLLVNIGGRLHLLVSQTGRCLGAFPSVKTEDMSVEFFLSKVGSISEKWKVTSQDAYNFMTKTNVLTSEGYAKLGEIIIGYYHAIGIEPEPRPDDTVYLRVP